MKPIHPLYSVHCSGSNQCCDSLNLGAIANMEETSQDEPRPRREEKVTRLENGIVIRTLVETREEKETTDGKSPLKKKEGGSLKCEGIEKVKVDDIRNKQVETKSPKHISEIIEMKAKKQNIAKKKIN